MFIINVWFTVNDPQNSDLVAELIEWMAEDVCKEKGCERFVAYCSQSEPVRLQLYEHGQSRDHSEAHRIASICKKINKPKVPPLVTHEAHPYSLVA